MEGRLLVGPGCRRPPAALGHPAQGQHVEADVAHPHRLVQLKLDDGDLLYRALVAQQASAVAAAGDRSQQESLVQLGVGGGYYGHATHQWCFRVVTPNLAAHS